MKKLLKSLMKKLRRQVSSTEKSSTTGTKIIIHGDPVEILKRTVLRILKEGQYQFDFQHNTRNEFVLVSEYPKLKVKITSWMPNLIDVKPVFTVLVSSGGNVQKAFHFEDEFLEIYKKIKERKYQEDEIRIKELREEDLRKQREVSREVLTQAYG